MIWPNGIKYEGSFDNDVICSVRYNVDPDKGWEISGYGTRDYTVESHYEGVLRNGERWGKGVQIWRDGVRYEGHWSNAKRSGLGMLTYADGHVFEGEFLDGEPVEK